MCKRLQQGYADDQEQPAQGGVDDAQHHTSGAQTSLLAILSSLAAANGRQDGTNDTRDAIEAEDEQGDQGYAEAGDAQTIGLASLGGGIGTP